MKTLLSPFAFSLVGAIFCPAQSAGVAGNEIERMPYPSRPGVALFTKVPDGPLLFSEQIRPRTVSGDAAAQAAEVIDSLAALLTQAGGDLRRIVRLNFYVSDDVVTPVIDAALATTFRDAAPAVSIVRSRLSTPGARLECDAVAAIDRRATGVEKIGSAAVLPAGAKAFISGQAKRGKDFADSVTQTMEALHASLPAIGVRKSDVVQVKAFINPMTDYALARMTIEKSYAGGPIPAIVITEWLANTPTEIELITAAPRTQMKVGENIEYHWIPGMPVSPYYCRMTTVAAGTPLIFIGNIDGGEAAPRDQWLQAFQRLAEILRDSGSSFRHMAKATYFLANPAAREFLGEIRSVFYAPDRPPAASAIDVQSIGVAGRAVGLDMIAVPTKRAPAAPAPK